MLFLILGTYKYIQFAPKSGLDAPLMFGKKNILASLVLQLLTLKL